MNRCLSEMNSCFSLLIPRLTQVLGNANSVEQVDLATHGIPVAMSAGRSIAIEVVVNLTPSVLPTHNNQPIRQTLVDCGSLVTKRYLPQIHKLINVATKVKGNEQLLIELNNWKSQFLDAQIKIAELKLSAAVPLGNDIESDSDENEFEEVLPEECLIEDYESPSTSYS